MDKNKNIFKKIERSKNLPSLPQVLVKLIEACNREGTTLKDISRITSKDPSLTSKVMRLVNSPYMAMREPVTSIEKAVLYLGADTIKNIAISASVLQVFSKTKGARHFNLNQFWWHSLMCALLSRRIAQASEYKHPEEAFLSGLLHDIAKLIFWRYFPKEYGGLISEFGIRSEGLLAGEKQLGASHAEIGAWLIRKWNLDPFMADAVHYHHEPLDDIMHAFPLVKIVYVANALSPGTSEHPADSRTIAGSVFGFSPSFIEEMIADAETEIQDLAASMDIPIEAPPAGGPSMESSPESTEMLKGQVKNISLLYGTLASLLQAGGQESILTTIERGLKILFDARAILFFLYDPLKGILVGRSLKDRPLEARINEMTIPVPSGISLLSKSLKQNRILTNRDVSDPSIGDKQILRLLGTQAMTCIPLSAYQQYVGVIVLGEAMDPAVGFSGQSQLMEMFAYHAAASLYVDELKQRETRRIQAERMEAVSTMARKVVHEVNNPLGIIKNYLKILGFKLPEKHPSQEDISIINQEIDRVSQIVGQLTTFSQSASSKIVKVDVNRVIRDQMKLMRPAILRPSGITDHLALGKNLPPLAGDPGRLKQVLSNLVRNSAEAMEQGGNLRIETRKLPASHKDSPPGSSAGSGSIEIFFSDDGPGIPEDIKRRLFEPFISSKGSEHRGLGMSIVHSIINEWKGTIACDSDGETGTAFKIVLPAGKGSDDS